jgi:hypothetical protein
VGWGGGGGQIRQGKREISGERREEIIWTERREISGQGIRGGLSGSRRGDYLVDSSWGDIWCTSTRFQHKNLVKETAQISGHRPTRYLPGASTRYLVTSDQISGPCKASRSY